MRDIKIGNREVMIYDSIDEMPIQRFHKYNKLCLIDSAVGSNLGDADNQIEKALRYINVGKIEQAVDQINNIRQSLYLIMNEVSPKYLSFACLIKKIGKKECNDISDEGLKRTLDKLKDLEKGQIDSALESIKKKIDYEMSMYFPYLFDDHTIKEYYDTLKSRVLTVLDSIVNDIDVEDKLTKIDNELFTFRNPMCLTGIDSEEIKYDKQFDSMCLVISRDLNKDSKDLTVREYYNAFEFLKKQKTKQNHGRK